MNLYTALSNSLTSLLGWIVLYTQPLREFAVEYQLINAGYIPYLPLTLTNGNPAPLFSRYIFLQYPEDFPSLREIKHITNILQQNSKPLIIPDKTIQSLRERENETGIIETEFIEPTQTYPPNTKINIVEGVYSGLNATFNKYLAKNQAEITLNFLGSKRSVQIGLDHITPAY